MITNEAFYFNFYDSIRLILYFIDETGVVFEGIRYKTHQTGRQLRGVYFQKLNPLLFNTKQNKGHILTHHPWKLISMNFYFLNIFEFSS